MQVLQIHYTQASPNKLHTSLLKCMTCSASYTRSEAQKVPHSTKSFFGKFYLKTLIAGKAEIRSSDSRKFWFLQEMAPGRTWYKNIKIIKTWSFSNVVCFPATAEVLFLSSQLKISWQLFIFWFGPPAANWRRPCPPLQNIFCCKF